MKQSDKKNREKISSPTTPNHPRKEPLFTNFSPYYIETASKLNMMVFQKNYFQV